VWLNASSSVKFPISFGAGPRIVEVTGEAYFEVARVNYSGVTNATELNSNQSSGYIPFVVHTNNQTIKVLGTHFNVNSYEDEDGERTTLLEGSVWVGPRRTEGGLPVSDQLNNAGGILLKPGQQVMFAAQGNSGDLQPTIINEVDTDKVVAWKNGFFAFNSADLQMVMRQIARWYDVDVKYEGNIHARFSGSVYRSEDFSELLKVIGFACNVKFKINHKTVTVYSD
ncbi:MAG TPA: FecR domain-containing protein, partial [Parasegetibacter sp.]